MIIVSFDKYSDYFLLSTIRIIFLTLIRKIINLD